MQVVDGKDIALSIYLLCCVYASHHYSPTSSIASFRKRLIEVHLKENLRIKYYIQ